MVRLGEGRYRVVVFFWRNGARSCSIVGAALFLEWRVLDIRRLGMVVRHFQGGATTCDDGQEAHRLLR